jgi:hypothetical protein
VSGGGDEHYKVTNLPGRNTNADCFEDRGATFSTSKDIYYMQRQKFILIIMSNKLLNLSTRATTDYRSALKEEKYINTEDVKR